MVYHFFLISILTALIAAFLLVRRKLFGSVHPVLRLTSFLLIGAAVILLYIQQNRLVQYNSFQNWMPVESTITNSLVIGVRAFRPEITYQYIVNDSIYTGITSFDRPSFGGRANRRASAQNIVSANPPGSQLRIFYNPANPKESRLNIHLPWDFYGIISFAGTLLLIGLSILFSDVLIRLFNRKN